MDERHDVIIIGMGLASLATAARLVESGIGNIGIYSTGYGGTPYIAAINFVLPDNPFNDTIAQYANDMMAAGYEINNPQLVKEMTENTTNGYELLKRWDVSFAKNEDGSTKLRHLSGHTHPRSLCSTKQLIGMEIVDRLEKGLLDKGVHLYKGCECVKVLTENNQVYGVTIKEQETLRNVYAPIVVAGWGGVGNLFGVSTYPADIRGNTLAIAKDAGADLIDIEFLEYEPMVVQNPPGAVGEPCPTAMLGEGAYLLNAKGERFMLTVRPQGEGGSPKTLINKQIWKEVEAGRGSKFRGVWVDLRHIDTEVLKAYPWFYNRLMENGVDPKKQLVDVGPMAHSISGGIKVDPHYCSSVKGFYAVGEACGGVHGACRCAGNAASQAALSGYLCAEAIAQTKQDVVEKSFPVTYIQNVCVYEQYVPEIRAIAVEALGIYRDGAKLQKAADRLNELRALPDIQKDDQTRQILDSIHYMVKAALNRKESRGTHMRLDFPNPSDEYKS